MERIGNNTRIRKSYNDREIRGESRERERVREGEYKKPSFSFLSLFFYLLLSSRLFSSNFFFLSTRLCSSQLFFSHLSLFPLLSSLLISSHLLLYLNIDDKVYSGTQLQDKKYAYPGYQSIEQPLVRPRNRCQNQQNKSKHKSLYHSPPALLV